MTRKMILLLGGARSGKSHFAEEWAKMHGEKVLFVATAQAFDEDMQARIARHQAERPSNWQTLESPLNLGRAIAPLQGEFDTILLDCITLLTANALLTLPEDCSQAESDAAISAEIESLLQVYSESNSTWLIISNEVGMGIVPPTNLGRVYRDSLGRANQKLAGVADEVWLLVAGLPWRLKPVAF